MALTFAGCGGGGEQPATEQTEGGGGAAPSAPAAQSVDPATAATITGRIAFTGQKPTPQRIRMDAVPACTEANSSPVFVQEVVVNDNNTLRNVFVYVKEGLSGSYNAPTPEVELDQRGCMYTPHVLGMTTGQSIRFKNADSTNHNVHPIPMQNREWNQSQPPGAADIVQQFARPEVMIPVKCNVHPWMIAYVGVLPHPFHAVSGEDGTFSITGLPPGNYVIEAWHEKFGTFTQNVTVGASETKEVEFTIQG
jgi:plastocyanin